MLVRKSTLLLLASFFLATLLLYASRPCQSAAVKDELTGFELVQMNKIFGRMFIRVCPGGLSFRSSLMSGFIVKRERSKSGKLAECIVTLVNNDEKNYRDIPMDRFAKSINSVRNPMFDQKLGSWAYILKKEQLGPKILGHPTYQLDYVLRQKVPPNVEFPDVMWISKDMPLAPEFVMFLETLFEHRMQGKYAGIPLRLVATTHLGPTRTALNHDTIQITPAKFVPDDFKHPKNYKEAGTDAEMFDFGMGMTR